MSEEKFHLLKVFALTSNIASKGELSGEGEQAQTQEQVRVETTTQEKMSNQHNSCDYGNRYSGDAAASPLFLSADTTESGARPGILGTPSTRAHPSDLVLFESQHEIHGYCAADTAEPCHLTQLLDTFQQIEITRLYDQRLAA